MPLKLTVNVNHVKRINAFDSKLYTLLRIFVKIDAKTPHLTAHASHPYFFVTLKIVRP